MSVTRLHADRGELSRFVNAVFCYADSSTYASLRAFDQFQKGVAAEFIRPIEINGSLEPLIDAAEKAAGDAANNPKAIVFAPPICTFSNPDRARLQDLANGLTLSVEIDDGDIKAARIKLESILGPATAVVLSGSDWTDPHTGEIQPKMHVHWRLSEPTREQDDHDRLRQAREWATMLAGADPTGKPVVHPLRWPGSWNNKNTPGRLAIIETLNETAEIHLAHALEQLQEAIEATGLTGELTPKKSGIAQAPLSKLQSAMAAVPNAALEIHYDVWMLLGYACWRSTATAADGYDLWDAWSRKSDKYNSTEQEAAWKRIGRAIEGSRAPRTVGAGTIFYLAKRAGWVWPPEPPPPDDDTRDPNYWKHLEAEPPQTEPLAEANLPTIAVERGELNRLATDGELALAASGLPIFQRGGTLVRPISHEVPAAHGRATMAAGFQNITTPAMIDLLAQAATWVVLNRRRRKVVPTDPPPLVASIILSRAGSWTVPSVAGIITTPTLRPGGTLLTAPGYDAATRLYHIADPSLADLIIPDEPTRAQAETAIVLLMGLLDGFPFNTAADRSVALSALITPVVRGALPVAPLHAIRASTAGTGKSYLVDLSSAIATGRPCPVASAAHREEETEKRIVGMILAGFPLVSIDNVNGALGSDLLCQVVERPLVRVRPLGGSEIIEIENRATFLATGNSLRVRGDMTRRTILCELDAGVERPELRTFETRPVETVLANRAAYVAACITICRAYLMARLPGRLDPLASFAEWSDLVRSSLVWLGCADPVNTMEIAREEDTEVIDMREVFTLWGEHIGIQTSTTALKIAEKACEQTYGGTEGFVIPEFRDALLRISGERGQVNTRRLAGWIRAREGRIINGLRIKRQETLAHGGGMQWQLIPVV